MNAPGLKYGSGTLPMDLRGLSGADRLEKTPGDLRDGRLIVEEAMAAASGPLDAFVRRGDRVAVVVSDHTRPTGSEIYVPVLLDALRDIGAADITIVIALGLHRPSTDGEIARICGGPLPDGVKVVNHSARDRLIEAGPARFNREALEADALIVTGAVTFHPMAGFSGGRKSLLPGIASAQDIYANHRLYFDGLEVHSGVGPGKATDNPVLDDIRERTRGCGNVWALNAVMTEKHAIEFAACGMVDDAWSACCRQLAGAHGLEISGPYDTVIASAGGAPSDSSFYQSMKVLTNASRACRPGGLLIILSECTGGWEIRDELFRYFRLGTRDIARELKADFSMDGLALYMALSIIRSRDVRLYSSLPAPEVEAAGMRAVGSPDDIFRMAAEWGGEAGARTALIPNGSALLPMILPQGKE